MIRTLLRVTGPAYAGPMRRTIALMTAAAVAEGLLLILLVPILRALLGGDPAGVWQWLARFAAAVAGYAVLRYAADLAGMRVGTTMLRGMYHRLGDHLARLPLGWYGTARVGEVSALAGRGLLAALGVCAHLLGPFITACVTPLTVVAVMTVVDWRFGLAALVAVPVVVAVQVGAARASVAADAATAARGDEAAARVVEYLQAQPVLRAGEQDLFIPLDDALRELEKASRRQVRAVVPVAAGTAVTVQIVFTGLLALGAWLAVDGSIGVPELLALLILASRAADPLLSLADVSGKLRAARTELDRLDRVLTTPPLPEPSRPVRPRDDGVQFDRVTFGDVLHGLSLTVPPGQRLAVTGPSGAGKSTMLRLIARFHDTGGGTVRVGGADVRDIGTEHLMSRIAIVFQDVRLFDGTIADNVRLARPAASDDEVRAAGAAAGLDFVDRLPGGWDTRVGEGGTMLSGGERQRVSIARALLKDTPIVLLDEITSALDPDTESAVHDALERLLTGRTVIMVAHRMRTVRRADRVVFLDGGRIVEDGTHDELLELGGRYASYWNLSMSGKAAGKTSGK
ncbi:MAG TPA: ABC transporter ATP-binding protein [Actinoplanes sp.]|nr:ABC transporter ATP-binding protein [Actinoplanes sp.]